MVAIDECEIETSAPLQETRKHDLRLLLVELDEVPNPRFLERSKTNSGVACARPRPGFHLIRIGRDVAYIRAVPQEPLTDEQRRHREPQARLHRSRRAFLHDPISQRRALGRADGDGKQRPAAPIGPFDGSGRDQAVPDPPDPLLSPHRVNPWASPVAIGRLSQQPQRGEATAAPGRTPPGSSGCWPRGARRTAGTAPRARRTLCPPRPPSPAARSAHTTGRRRSRRPTGRTRPIGRPPPRTPPPRRTGRDAARSSRPRRPRRAARTPSRTGTGHARSV